MPESIQKVYTIRGVLVRRDKLLDAAKPFVGRQIDATQLHALVAAFGKCLPKTIPTDILFDSLSHLLSSQLTTAAASDNAWRIAGNVDRLTSFHSVPPWSRQVLDEYVPVQILGMRRRFRFGQLRWEVTLQILAGTSTPRRIQKMWAPKFCGMLSRSFGFSKPWGEYRYEHPLQMVGMRCYVLVESSLCTAAGPGFEKLWTNDEGNEIKPHSCYSYNHELVKLRTRERSEFACPKNFPRELPCHRCIIGYDQCPLAAHAMTMTMKKCTRCDNTRPHDPELTSEICVECYDKQIRGKAQ
jgi:hypothetical protein